jgi:cytochrome P450 family 3 subfamily A
LINHLKKIFNISLANLLFLILLISPRLAIYLAKKGYSVFPSTPMNYITNVINQILTRRRQHPERRNDFIQIMVDHEKEIKHEEQINQQTEKPQGQQWGTLSKTLNDREIVGQALIFMLAGYETTSVLMSFFFYVMATEPMVQEKVYDEIRQELGDDEVTHEKLSQLQYLDMVINETLRMYPPFIRFDRVASQNYQLGNYQIPKGCVINVPVYPIHHDPNSWPEPEKFIPERFSPGEKAKRHPMAFLPFGDGPRNCVGMRFALLEAKIAMAKALRLVEFQKCEKTEVPLELGKLVILNSKNTIWLRVTRRSQ